MATRLVDYFDLRRIMYDAYEMDYRLPPMSLRWREQFKNKSYERWAIKIIEREIYKSIYPKQSASLEKYTEILDRIIEKSERYIWEDERFALQFDIARNVAYDIKDLLWAMA